MKKTISARVRYTLNAENNAYALRASEIDLQRYYSESELEDFQFEGNEFEELMCRRDAGNFEFEFEIIELVELEFEQTDEFEEEELYYTPVLGQTFEFKGVTYKVKLSHNGKWVYAESINHR